MIFKRPTIPILILFLFAIILGVFDANLDPSSSIPLPSGILHWFALAGCLYYWSKLDIKTNFPKEKIYWSIAISLFSFIFLPIYLFKTRGIWKGLVALFVTFIIVILYGSFHELSRSIILRWFL